MPNKQRSFSLGVGPHSPLDCLLFFTKNMIQRLAYFVLCLAFSSATLAQTPASTPTPAEPEHAESPAPAEQPKPATVRVNLQTSAGTIVLELEKERAPVTTANFLRYVDKKRFDGASFYRAARSPNASQIALIQGGVSNEPKLLFPPIIHEPTTLTGLSHTDGTISMARAAPGSAAGDFFIIIGGMTGLDANPAEPGDNLGFAAFGHVVEGMDVVHRILDAPISQTAGEGIMRGQMLAAPIRIISARRAPGETAASATPSASLAK